VVCYINVFNVEFSTGYDTPAQAGETKGRLGYYVKKIGYIYKSIF
jgi:hypothetical protein